MKLVIQRTLQASVTVDGETVARIERGLLVLAGVERGDDPATCARAADRISGLRIFPDETGRMRHDVREIGGSVLLVSQFTLCASLDRGRRPSFDRAEEPNRARELVARLAADLEIAGVRVEQGVFGADMKVALINDGPVTFHLDVPGSRAAGEQGT